MTKMEPRLSLITLGVADLDRAIRFYREGLGLPQRESPPSIAFFETRGTWLSLYARKSLAEDAQLANTGEGWGGFSIAHNVRTEEEVQPLIDRAVESGGTLVKPAQRADWGGWSGYFLDPDGFLWEVAHNPYFWIE